MQQAEPPWHPLVIRRTELGQICTRQLNYHRSLRTRTKGVPVHGHFNLPICNAFHFCYTPCSYYISRFSHGQIFYLVPCIEVDKYHALSNLSLYFPQSVLPLVESRHVFKLRGFDQISFRVITPSVIPAPQYRRASTGLLCHSICTMPTNIVERTQLSIFSENHDEREAGKIVSTIVTWFSKSADMGYEYPGPDVFQSNVCLSVLFNIPC